MICSLNFCSHLFRAKILFILGLYFFTVFTHKSIFLFTTCHNWYDEKNTCKDTNIKIGLLLILLVQDFFFSFKKPIVILSPLFYTISFLFFLSIFSLHCNVYLDIITATYNLFLFIVSYFVYDEYEKINDKSQKDTNDDYPNVEVRTFAKKRPQTVYYQAIDEI